MKTKIKVSEFSRLMKICFNAIDKKDTIRSNIMFEAENDELKIKATNAQYSVEVGCSADIDEEGVAIVDGSMAYSVISKASGDCVLSSDNKSMTIKTNGRTKLPNINRDLPMIDATEGKEIKFDASAFKNAYNKISYAISEDESRIILTGAHIVTHDSNAVFTSLDGFRLAETVVCCEGDDIDVVIPSRILDAVCDAITGETLIMRCDGHHISFIGEGFQINAISLSGDYIDTTRIIPTEFKTKVLVNTSELKDLLDSATVASGSSNLVKLDIKDDRITVKSNSEDADFTGDVNAMLNGDDIVIAFNLKYLLHAINHIDTEQCELCFNTSVSPVIVFPYKEGVIPDKNLILPVRLFG